MFLVYSWSLFIQKKYKFRQNNLYKPDNYHTKYFPLGLILQQKKLDSDK